MTAVSLLLVGAGHMGSALLRAWLSSADLIDTARSAVIDPALSPEASKLCEDQGIGVNPVAPDLNAFDIVVLAVKPNKIAEVARGLIGSGVKPTTVFMSIAAGQSLLALADATSKDAAIIRAMPNLPAAIGRGMTGLFANAHASDRQREIAETLMNVAGETLWLSDEPLMDALTAVSGSGPAYLFLLAECLAGAAVSCGFDEEAANRLARATITGASAMLDAEGSDPADLRRRVTSPGGTTEAAMQVLMGPQGIGPAVREGVRAAMARARQLNVSRPGG